MQRPGPPEVAKPKEERKEKDVKPLAVEVRGPREVVRKAEKPPGLKKEEGPDVKEMTAEERKAHKSELLQRWCLFVL